MEGMARFYEQTRARQMMRLGDVIRLVAGKALWAETMAQLLEKVRAV